MTTTGNTTKFELRSLGAARAWVGNFDTAKGAYSALDGYAPKNLKLRVVRSDDLTEVARVDYLKP